MKYFFLNNSCLRFEFTDLNGDPQVMLLTEVRVNETNRPWVIYYKGERLEVNHFYHLNCYDFVRYVRCSIF